MTSVKYLLAASALLLASPVVHADQRFAHKSGTAAGATCGANSNIADATNGPCTTIAQAYTNAKNGGGAARIIVISNGNFAENVVLDYTGGPTEIRVSGDARPSLGGSSGAPLTINAPGQDVRIFDLRIVGSSAAGTNGIDVTAVNTLELHRVEMRGFTNLAINMSPASGNNAAFYVFDSNIANSTAGCILIRPTGSTSVNTVIKNSQIHHSNGYGIRTESTATTSLFTVKTLISNSIVSNFSNTAIVSVAALSGGVFARTVVENTDVLNANNGVVVNGDLAQMVLNGATISGNTTGVSIINNGDVYSFGNSVIAFNTTNGPAPQTLTRQ